MALQSPFASSFPSAAGINSPYSRGRTSRFGGTSPLANQGIGADSWLTTGSRYSPNRADEQAASEREAMQQVANIQSPYQQAQTEQLQAQTRNMTSLPLTQNTPHGSISLPAYDQYVLQQARLEAEGKQSGINKAESDARESAGRQAQEALLRLQGDQRQAELRLQESLMAERENRRRGAIPDILKSIPGLDESQYQTAAIDEGEEAASNLAFSRAREQAGSSGLAAIRALREMMAGQGLAGSTVEAAGLGNVVGDVRGTVGHVATEQALRKSQRAGQRADRDVSTKNLRRAQDISRQQALQQLMLGSIY